ncbi:MAG: hypothetical protein KDC07_07190 [Chitinophagaceae bacterium]|nr:hypothetical protein [Chitinophagaceae bacterium]MCB9045625.1 hypothetical protein [Chitinophagales bacterium]
MSEPFYKRMWQKPPVVFPWIAIFHVGFLLYLLYDNIVDPVGGLILVQPLIMLLYTISWLFVCDMKKWAAITYIGLTTLNLALRFVLTDQMDKVYFTDTIFPADALFTFFIMFYFRKFE